MKKVIFPSVSVVIAVRDEPEALSRCLSSIRCQYYRQKKLEIVVADGSAGNLCAKVIDKYRGLRIADRSGSPEKAKAAALALAKGPLVLFVDADNILPTGHWLKEMVSILEKEPHAVGCYPWRYAYIPSQTALNRYFSLIGINDPVAFFFGKADRQSYLTEKWDLSGKADDQGDYFLVSFNQKNVPTLGANGILARRKLLLKAKINPEYFFHIDIHSDLIRKGHCRYAVAKNSIIHNPSDSLSIYLKKRWRYLTDLYLRDFSKRRYLIYDNRQDQLKLVGYIGFTLLVLPNVLISLRGFKKIPDPAWFFHPILAFLIMVLYSAAVFLHIFQSALRGKYHSTPS
jgi:glycosyltransferase involved in cell wall biosynthesis